jgi:hypothetical protein
MIVDSMSLAREGEATGRENGERRRKAVGGESENTLLRCVIRPCYSKEIHDLLVVKL